MNEVNLSSTINQYLRNTQSAECRAFMEGARSILTALQLAQAADYPRILSTKNQQHIIALLVQSAEQQRERRREDAKQLLKLYDFKKAELLAFIFDRGRIDPDSGRALNRDGEYVEDEMFRPLPDKAQLYWGQYTIEPMDGGKAITRKQFDKLSERDQDDYDYRRFFHLTLNGQTAMKISDADTYLMEELIRQVILIGDPEVNRRFLTEIYSDAETCTTGRLYFYRTVILDALSELRRNQGDYEWAPMLIGQANLGYIKTAGQLLIAQLQELCVCVKANQLLRYSAADIRRWIKVVWACYNDNPDFLANLITKADIAGYRNIQGNPLNKATYNRDDDNWVIVPPHEEDCAPGIAREHFFTHIFMPEVCRRLQQMLERVLNDRDIIVTGVAPATMAALHDLDECLRSNLNQDTAGENPEDGDPEE